MRFLVYEKDLNMDELKAVAESRRASGELPLTLRIPDRFP